MSTGTIILGPEHHGERMSLDDFERAEAHAGFLYELSRGVIQVIDVPKPRHGYLVRNCRRQLESYAERRPGVIDAVFGGSECKLLVRATETERHPDLAVYLQPCPDVDADVWSQWVPEIVVEVVSRGSRKRDYDEKPEDYFECGVREYWIIDPSESKLHVLARSATGWTEAVLCQGEVYESLLLPGFQFDLQQLFESPSL
jgi:Uma2 family endonuclease